MELINPNELTNYSINDDYYCSQFIKKHIEEFHSILDGIEMPYENVLKYKYRKRRIILRLEEDKPVNLSSLSREIRKIVNDDFHGCYTVAEIGFYDSGDVYVLLNIIDPYRMLYEFYYKDFHKKVLGILNECIEVTSTRTDYKHINLGLIEPEGSTQKPLHFILKLLDDIFTGSTVYKTKVIPNGAASYTYFRVSWDMDEVVEEDNLVVKEEEELPLDNEVKTKPSFMGKVREYVKRLVHHEKS